MQITNIDCAPLPFPISMAEHSNVSYTDSLHMLRRSTGKMLERAAI